MTVLTPEIRARTIRAAVLAELDRFATILGDAALASVKITVNVSAGGVPRSVVVEPQFRVESVSGPLRG